MHCLKMWEQMMHKLLFILYKKTRVDYTKHYSDVKCQATPTQISRAVGIDPPKSISIEVCTDEIRQKTTSTQYEEDDGPGVVRKLTGFFF